MSNFISNTLTYHDGIFFPEEVLLLWTGSITKKRRFFQQVFLFQTLFYYTSESDVYRQSPLWINQTITMVVDL